MTQPRCIHLGSRFQVKDDRSLFSGVTKFHVISFSNRQTLSEMVIRILECVLDVIQMSLLGCKTVKDTATFFDRHLLYISPILVNINMF